VRSRLFGFRRLGPQPTGSPSDYPKTKFNRGRVRHDLRRVGFGNRLLGLSDESPQSGPPLFRQPVRDDSRQLKLGGQLLTWPTDQPRHATWHFNLPGRIQFAPKTVFSVPYAGSRTCGTGGGSRPAREYYCIGWAAERQRANPDSLARPCKCPHAPPPPDRTLVRIKTYSPQADTWLRCREFGTRRHFFLPARGVPGRNRPSLAGGHAATPCGYRSYEQRQAGVSARPNGRGAGGWASESRQHKPRSARGASRANCRRFSRRFAVRGAASSAGRMPRSRQACRCPGRRVG
jgi:hypothetical protein